VQGLSRQFIRNYADPGCLPQIREPIIALMPDGSGIGDLCVRHHIRVSVE